MRLEKLEKVGITESLEHSVVKRSEKTISSPIDSQAIVKRNLMLGQIEKSHQERTILKAKKTDVMNELKRKAHLIHRHSATRSAANVSLEEHHRNVASMLTTQSQQGRYTHDQYANQRYGESGTMMLEQLRSIHPGMQDLIVDPALMSKTHLSDFAEFAKALSNTRQRNEQSQLSPWQMRREYEASLPKQTWYRGLKLDEGLGKRLVKQGIHSRVTRTLDSIQSNTHSRGIFKQLLSGKRQDTLPNLDEAFDKPIKDVIMHRVNKQERARGREFREIKLDKRSFTKTLTPWRQLSPLAQKTYKSTTGYHNKTYAQYVEDYKERKRIHMNRQDDEAATQSVTRHRKVGIGFGGSDLFGGGKPSRTERVFNYNMTMSPLH